MTEIEITIAASRAVWDANAEAWHRKVSGGQMWQTTLIGPAVEKLLGVEPDERVLDVACGDGTFSRRLVELGAEVVASDFSVELIRLARKRPSAGIDYFVADATSEEELLMLGQPNGFDAAVCNMALMDMPVIEPLYRSLFRLLKPGGRFVFSVMHPCFNGQAISMLAERPDYAVQTEYSVQVREYSTARVTRGLAISEQPEQQYYWHRPVQNLLNPAFDAGFLMDRFEEPRIAPNPASKDTFDWAHYDLPPILYVRLRKPG